MLESYIRTGDGKDYVDVDCVREALGIKDDEDIFRAIEKLKEERDELKEKCDKMKKRANAMYGVSCGKEPVFLCDVISYSWSFGAIDTPFPNNSIRVELNLTPTANYKGTFDLEDLKKYIQNYGREKKLGIIESVDYQNAKAARAELAYLYKQVLGKEKLDRDLSPHEVMKAILDEYDKREDFIRELSCSLGFGDPVVKPDNIDQKEKDILERIEKLKGGVWPCENSSTFAEYLRKEFPKFCKRYNVVPLMNASIHDWIQYIFDVLSEYRGMRGSGWARAEKLIKDKRAVEDSLAELRAKIREIYRSVVDDEWYEHLSYTSALNDINEEYKRVVHNFEERTADWSKAQNELDRYRLAVGSLLDIPKEARDDINAIERAFTFSKKQYESLKEFRDDVCEIFDIPSNMADRYVLKEIHDVVDHYDELEDFRADICGALDIEGMLGTPQRNDKYILEQVEKLRDNKPTVFRNDVAVAIGMTTKDSNPDIIKRVMEIRESHDKLARLRSNICTALCLGGETSDEDILKRVRMTRDCHDALCKDYAKLHDDYIASQKQVKGFTNRCDSLEDLQRDLWILRRNAIEDLKSRGFCFRPEENETLPEIYDRLLKRYDWAYGEYKEQYRLRQCWHVRWESENERANGEHKRAEKLNKEVRDWTKRCDSLKQALNAKSNEEVGLSAFKNECRKLRDEKAKVISALGQDIWDDAVK